MAEPARHYSAKTLAAHWGVSPGLIYKLCKSGELPHLRIGDTIRITRDQVAEYEARQCQDQSTKHPDTGLQGDPMGFGSSAGQTMDAAAAYRLGQQTRTKQIGYSEPSSPVVVQHPRARQLVR